MLLVARFHLLEAQCLEDVLALPRRRNSFAVTKGSRYYRERALIIQIPSL